MKKKGGDGRRLSGLNRREFLKASAGALGVGAALIGGGIGFPAIARAAKGKVKNPIKIACQGVASGPLGNNGDFMNKGALLAVEEINGKGGILGSKIEFNFRDDESKVDVAIKNARYFVDTWDADFLIGIDSSGVALALGQIMPDLNRILIVTHGSTNKYNEEIVFKKGIKQCFRSSVPLYQDACAGALVAKDFPAKQWAAILPDYEYGHTSWKLFKQTLKTLRPDVEFVADSFAKSGTVDFSSHIAKVMGANPEAIFSVEWGGELVTLIKQCQLFEVYKKVKYWMAGMGGAMDVLQGLGREYPEGLWGTTRYWFLYPDNPKNKAFVDAYHKRWNNYPSHNSESAYTAVHMIKQAVEKAQTLEIKELIAAMEGMQIDRPAGPCYIRKEDHQAVYSVPWGQIKHDPKYPFPILTNLKVFPAEKYYLHPPFTQAG